MHYLLLNFITHKQKHHTQGVTLDNLDLSVPTDEARAERSSFLECTARLDSCVQTDGSVSLPSCPIFASSIISSLKTISDLCSPAADNGKVYRSLLVTNAAIFTLMNLLGVQPPGEDADAVLLATVRALRVLTKER